MVANSSQSGSFWGISKHTGFDWHCSPAPPAHHRAASMKAVSRVNFRCVEAVVEWKSSLGELASNVDVKLTEAAKTDMAYLGNL